MIEILLSVLLLMTGIARTPDPELTAIAQRRASEVINDWSHNGMDPRYYEVLAYNNHPDPAYSAERAVVQWSTSPSHWTILTNPTLTRIGCGSATTTDGYTYYACVLTTAPVVAPAPEPAPPPPAPSPEPAVSAPEPQPVVMTLPDTALPAP